MKRKSEEFGSGSFKKHKGGNSDQQNGHFKHHNSPRQHQANGMKQEATVSSSAYNDPLTSLQSILKTITEKPEEAEKQLGSKALKYATKLFENLKDVESSSTASLDLCQPSTSDLQAINPYYAGSFLRSTPLPLLPDIPPGPLAEAPFIHKSTVDYVRGVKKASDLNYEQLEFLGDAYLEIIATRLIFARYPHFAAGRQAQVRELLVKNETLLGFSKAYGFLDKLQATQNELKADINSGKNQLGKILADVFEAYVAAIVLSDPEEGFKRVEAWMTELWAPILLHHYGPESEFAMAAEYDPEGKAKLQKRIHQQNVKVEYRQEKPMETINHIQRFFIAVYLTGWGYDNERLGYGEGQNKAEAGNRAAMDAMTKRADVVEDAERQLAEFREKRRLEREAEQATNGDS